jgi:hypothetical protein
MGRWSVDYICRLGLHGQVGRLAWGGGGELERGTRVLCRSRRGLEIAELLTAVPAVELGGEQHDGRIVRRLAPEDLLLEKHLLRYAAAAQRAGQRWLKSAGVAELLVDVEPLMDGRTLYFHFLGPVPAATTEQLQPLVEIYQRLVQNSRFARQLAEGCGPGCGTEAATGGCGASGSGGCAVCVVADACRKRQA